MKTERFQLTFSGTNLIETQRAHVAAQLNVALPTAIFGDSPGLQPVKCLPTGNLPR